jgi:hypothetical protein
MQNIAEGSHASGTPAEAHKCLMFFWYQSFFIADAKARA